MEGYILPPMESARSVALPSSKSKRATEIDPALPMPTFRGGHDSEPFVRSGVDVPDLMHMFQAAPAKLVINGLNSIKINHFIDVIYFERFER